MTVEQAWRAARTLHRLSDAPEMRQAFYAGAMHAFGVVLEAAPDTDALLVLNDELHGFASATLKHDALPL